MNPFTQKTTVVSFEEHDIKVIRAVKIKKALIIEETHSLTHDQFDAFLEHEKSREFCVVVNFADSFTGTLHVPPAKDRFLATMIEAEIRKSFKLEQFEYIYTDLGEKQINKKRKKEIFVYAVDHKHIMAILERFMRHGKSIKALYPDLFAVAQIAGSGSSNVLGVMEAGTTKNLFLMNNGRISFIRVVQAFDRGLTDIDVQNINMTINYCRQTLKMSVERATVLGSLCSAYTSEVAVPVPMQSFVNTDLCTPVQDRAPGPGFIAPLSALRANRGALINMLPKKIRSVFIAEKMLRYATAFFLAAMLIIFFQAGIITNQIIDQRKNIITLRANLPDIFTVMDQYYQQNETFEPYRPFLASYRASAALPDISALITRLATLQTDGISLDRIAIIAAGDDMFYDDESGESKPVITLEGIAAAGGYAQMQNNFQAFTESIRTEQQFEIAEKFLDLKTRQLKVQVIFK
ncbi:MAG: hypothetical protein GY850_14850 [bacterium]|nr:hypothetical protein [bacterium]